MGASAREFLLMREDEVNGELYVPSLRKKEIKERAEIDVELLLDRGELDIANSFMDATRMNEYLTVFTKELKKHITEEEYGKDYEVKGAKISFRNSGDRLDYNEDEVYKSLGEKLKERELILKTASKSKDMIFDSEGVEVPKVGIKTFGNESVVITY